MGLSQLGSIPIYLPKNLGNVYICYFIIICTHEDRRYEREVGWVTIATVAVGMYVYWD